MADHPKGTGKKYPWGKKGHVGSKKDLHLSARMSANMPTGAERRFTGEGKGRFEERG